MAQVRQQNIVGRWVPSAGATSFRLLDRSGRGNHGTLTDITATAWQPSGGKVALIFVNPSNAILTNPVPLGTVHTSSAWLFNGDAASFNFQGFNGDNDTVGNLCSLSFIATGAASNLVTFGYSYLTTAVTVSVPNVHQRWVHAVTVRSGQFVEFYLNGSFVGSGTGVGMGAFSPDRIGQRSASVSYRGSFDDYTLFNIAMTAAEVREIYRRGRGYGIGASPHRSRRAAASAFKAYWAKRQSQLIGGGL
jgi:hypothetical protein